MKNSIREELSEYIAERVEEIKKYDGREMNELHYHLFNEDYYIIGYYQAEQWLMSHRLSVFEAIGIVQEYENEHFGEARMYDNAEKVVNMLAYIYGEELLNEMDLNN
jgi:hypothetical protein